MGNLPQLEEYIHNIEPALDSVMYFREGAPPEGFRLRGSVCGFASSVLADHLRRELATDATLLFGAPFDEPERVPKRMRTHVLIKSEKEEVLIDPTATQFMALVGLDIHNAHASEQMASIYPEWRVAVIAKGEERSFGERFADFTLEQIPRIIEVRRSMGKKAMWTTDDKCAWMPREDAFEMLADIWNPLRYTVLHEIGDSPQSAREASSRLSRMVKKVT